MYYSYVLHSDSDDRSYIGATSDLKARFSGHAQGRVRAIRARRPLRLAYYEAGRKAADAHPRERYLKSGRGNRYHRQRLSVWLGDLSPGKLERH